MNNISFRAKLVVDDSLYKKVPEGTPEGYIDDLVSRYKKFIDHPVMQKVTEGDTIELYRAKHRLGYAIGINYKSDALKETIESGIFTNKKEAKIVPGELIYDTMTYIIIKSGIDQKFSKRHKENFLDAVKELLKKTQN